MTSTALPAAAERQADVIVVGAGPAGSDRRHLPRPGRRRRAAAGEDGVPAREGLRRRTHPARGEAAGLAWASTSTSPAGSSNQGLRIVGGGNRLELPWPDARRLPELRPRPHPDGLRRDPRPPRPEGRRPAARADRRHRARPRRATGRIVGVTAKPVDDNGRKVGDEVDVPRPDRRRCRRQLHPAQPRDGTAEARQPADGRRGPHLLPQPPPRRRLAGVLAGAVGRQAGREQPAARATAGSSGSATAPSTSASAS